MSNYSYHLFMVCNMPLLQNKADFIDRCFDTLIQATEEDRGPYTDFTEKMMTILKSV